MSCAFSRRLSTFQPRKCISCYKRFFSTAQAMSASEWNKYYEMERQSELSSKTQIANPKRMGRVKSIDNTIANIEGFTDAKPYSFVEFESGARGLVLNVNSKGCKIGIIDDGFKRKSIEINSKINTFSQTNGMNNPPQTLVGPGLIGRIVDVFGNDFLYSHNQPNTQNDHSGNGNFNGNESMAYKLPVWRVNTFPNKKYQTHWTTYSRTRSRIHCGIKSIDTFYPIMRGWRTALIGSSNHRKSEIAIDILLSFADSNELQTNIREKMFGVYVMIGKPVSEIWRLYEMLYNNGALEYSTIVASRNDDLMSKQLLTAYTGAAIADFYKFYGMNAFIVYDDLSTENEIRSRIEREGNDQMAYANWSGQLLERCAQLSGKYGGGSHTALCLADTDGTGNSSAFYNYLTHLVSHVDQPIMLSDQSYSKNLVPPISLFPVPYGLPKSISYSKESGDIVWRLLSAKVSQILFALVESEDAYRKQVDLDLHHDMEPELDKIANNLQKLQILFTQTMECDERQLLMLLAFISQGMAEYVHHDQIRNVEGKLFEFGMDIDLCAIYESDGLELFWENVHGIMHDFLDVNEHLCKPAPLNQQELSD